MPSFKPKPFKKINVNVKATTTLDGKHNEFMEKFQSEEESILPTLHKKHLEYAHRLQMGVTLEDKLEIEDAIKEIKRKKSEIKKKKLDYLLDNSKYIFPYFEKKKNISSGQNEQKVLNSFFNIEQKEVSEEQQLQENIVNKYLSNIDHTFIDMSHFITEADVCKYCRQGELIAQDDEGILVCNQCFKHVSYLIDNEKPSYKEPPKEVCFYAYQRINHFREILAQFQAKETTQIPEDVIENIKNQLKKERIHISQLTEKKMKEILKRLGLSKYYEHIAFIKYKLGIQPPVMTPELEETLCNLFMEIQGPYSKYCPDDRTNFLSYRYTVYKMCELLGQTQFLPHLSMLKDKVKRIEQDEIWKKICEDLDWEFMPTL